MRRDEAARFMCPILLALLRSVPSAMRSLGHLSLENLPLRQQLALLQKRSKRPQFGRPDRLFWAWLSQCWSGWCDALCLLRPETVVRWHRQGFRTFWTAEVETSRARTAAGGLRADSTHLPW